MFEEFNESYVGSKKLSNDEMSVKLIGKLANEFSFIEQDFSLQLEIKRAIDEIVCKYDVYTQSTALVKSDLMDMSMMYIATKKLEGLSPKTLKNYQLELIRFHEIVKKPIRMITTNDIRGYLAIVSRELKASTQNTITCTIRSFFKWLTEEEYIQRNPVNKIKQNKVPKRVRCGLSEKELEIIRESCETRREKALIELIFSTGCRLGEIIKLNKSDLNFTDRSILVIGKGDKQRKVFFSPRAEVMLNKYLKLRKDENEALFVSDKRPYGRLGSRSIQKAIKKIAERTDIGKSIFPHLIRHTFAMTRLNGGMSLPTLQTLMGHTSPATTQIYAVLTDTNIKYEYNKTT